MGPKAAGGGEHDLFRMELVNLIDQRHELVRLAALIDWDAFSQQWSPQFTSTTGRPALPTRLMAALLYLKHVYALSDEDVVERWCENPYWQHFSGERYFRHELILAHLRVLYCAFVGQVLMLTLLISDTLPARRPTPASA